MIKKRKPILVYWLMMVVLFAVVLLAQQIVASIMQGSLAASKYGSEATFEILWAGLVLLVVLFFKNKYIFTQKREGFFRSVKYVLPELLLSSLFVLISLLSIIVNSNSIDIYAIFNLILYCLFIGIVEEFLCRGWLLNEFLERYSQNRKEILLSIFFSSLVFGVIHFLNVGETQNFFETLVQVMHATAGGVFLALVYYKTKNIWVVVATHAIWDFSLFLGDANSLGECLAPTPTTLSVLMSVLQGIGLIIAYSFFCYWLYRQTDLYTKEYKNGKDYLIGIGVAFYVLSFLFIHDYSSNDSLCPSYQTKNIHKEYLVSYYRYRQYPVGTLGLVLEVDPNTDRLWIKNTKSGETAYLTEKKEEYKRYLLVDNEYTFSIIIQTSSNVILYGNYQKSDFTLQNESFMKSLKSGLQKQVAPNIEDLCVIHIEGDSYYYPALHNDLGELLYFNQDGELYIHKK